MEIDFLPIENEGKGRNLPQYQVVVDGIIEKESFIVTPELPLTLVTFTNEPIIEKLKQTSIIGLRSYFEEFDLVIKHHVSDIVGEVFIKVEIWDDSGAEDPDFTRIYVSSRIDSYNWAKPWTILQFIDEFYLCLSDHYIKFNDSSIQGDYKTECEILLRVKNDTSSLGEALEPALDAFLNCLKLADKRLRDNVNAEAVVTYFRFPDAIKSACEQYLIYFTQFIADLGIDVESQIIEEPNQTLFKITPKDKSEALSRIREALDIYLNAPAADNFPVQAAEFGDISVKQWEANIYHLKSQLAIANSLLQMKDATIEALQLSNFQYKKTIDDQEKTKGEDVIKGVVSVKKFEKNGVSIDFAEILRRIKRRWSKG